MALEMISHVAQSLIELSQKYEFLERQRNTLALSIKDLKNNKKNTQKIKDVTLKILELDDKISKQKQFMLNLLINFQKSVEKERIVQQNVT